MEPGGTGFASIDSPGGRLFFGYAPIRGTRWTLAMETPRSDFMQVSWDPIFTGLIFAAVLLVFFVIVFNFFIRRVLTNPLRLITFNAHKLALGSYIQKLPGHIVSRGDEIGQLGGAFLSMSDSIKRVISAIEHIAVSARAGNLSERGEYFSLYGDYQRIIEGVNTAFDVVCAHFDAMPEAIALFGESRMLLYSNRAMNSFFIRHGFDPKSPELLARVISSGSSGELDAPAASLFEPGGENHDVYTAAVALHPYNYALSLQHTQNEAPPLAMAADPFATILKALNTEHGAEAAREHSVMLILSDVTLLTRAKVDAEAASRAKSNFLANMSHEMRTPMNAIIGMAKIALSSAADMEKKNHCLEKIDEAADHLLGVIGDILDMSKIEAEKFELSPVEFEFEKTLRRVMGGMGFRMESKRQSFSMDIAGDIPPVFIGDDQRLSQVLTNILGNAIKFTPEGGAIRLSARLDGEEEDGLCRLRMEVADTGIGISEEQKGGLFLSFQQADGDISRKFGGTGLGLAISKHIVEMMGGAIQVESEPGKGSRFIFTVALRRGGEKTEDGPAASSGGTESRGSPAETASDNFAGCRIILAEDVDINREIVLALLEPASITVDCAGNGEEALSLFSADPGRYDMIFMDVHMPEMDGYEATRRIRALEVPQAKTIPIVAMTANVFREDVEKCLAVGMNSHIGKPLDFEAVLATLRKYLAGKPAPPL
ncbi:MAG: ATP-binding protein [Spirochaetaceae bacterium]|nr:ATP-binding protein [Spirochaetaceae bacterium]